jgi:hypothetical protein
MLGVVVAAGGQMADDDDADLKDLIAVTNGRDTKVQVRSTCAIGKFSGSSYQLHKHACFPCPSGKYGVFVAHQTPSGTLQQLSSCASCPAGQYQKVWGKDFCNDCSAKDTKLVIDDCLMSCKPGFYSHWEDSSLVRSCSPCGVGQFMPDTGSAFCFKCEPGKFADQRGARACKTCPAGKFGHFSKRRAVSVCKECAPGRFQPSAGKGHCTDCKEYRQATAGPSGRHCVHSCPRGRFRDGVTNKYHPNSDPDQAASKHHGAAVVVCSDCPPGKRGAHLWPSNPTGSDACLPCEVGRFMALAGQIADACHPCAPGQSAPETGAVACSSNRNRNRNRNRHEGSNLNPNSNNRNISTPAAVVGGILKQDASDRVASILSAAEASLGRGLRKGEGAAGVAKAVAKLKQVMAGLGSGLDGEMGAIVAAEAKKAEEKEEAKKKKKKEKKADEKEKEEGKEEEGGVGWNGTDEDQGYRTWNGTDFAPAGVGKGAKTKDARHKKAKAKAKMKAVLLNLQPARQREKAQAKVQAQAKHLGHLVKTLLQSQSQSQLQSSATPPPPPPPHPPPHPPPPPPQS